ncbi:MAG TPA: hypothetical protein VFP34_18815 [Microlunatus sp.]|nr:hypothetical protein [Microlunatus sp.]
MTRIVGIHQLELRAGVDPVEFGRVCADVVAAPTYPGWRTRILKGERGARVDQYVVLFEIDSVEDRDRIFPSPEQHSEEAQRFDEENPAGVAPWERFFSLVDREPDLVTDYSSSRNDPHPSAP